VARTRIPVVMLVALLGVLWTSTAWAAGFLESWYLSRGNANMAIGNYKAAIEAFEKVMELNPDNREALRNLGLAYERQGLTDKAIEQFDRYLQTYDDDPEIAFKQAQALEWSRYRYREKDMLNYYRMGLRRRDDPAMRLRYAGHLAGRKDTNQEAIRQFEQVLAQEPRNPEAHRGLARAYAWLGDNDRALYHANLALRSSPREGGDLPALRRDMARGREPNVQGRAGFLVQPEKPFELYGFRLGSAGKVDLTPFTTTTVEAGLEHVRDSSADATGAYASLATQYRFNPTNRLDGQVEYRGVTRANRFAFRLEYGHDGDAFSVRPGIRREYKEDSFTALVGSRIDGRLIGAARATHVYSEVALEAGALHLSVTPFVGWISAESLSNNEQLGLEAKAALPIWRGAEWAISGEYLAYLTHYGEDHSGVRPSDTEPLPGGYFSPRLFVNQIPRVVASYVGGDRNAFSLAVGPAFQYIDEARTAPAFRLGADAHASYTAPVSSRLLARFMADVTQIASVHTRVQIQALLVYTF
jgi:tetratricopeptide (TPR) repeat protein